MGFWLNQDGLPLQFGTTKAIPELGGDYLLYGENREIETYVCLGNTIWGTGTTPNVPNIPSSFQGTPASWTTTANTGILGYTTLFPLQGTAPITVAGSTGLLSLTNVQVYIDQIDLEVLVAANAGTGAATGLTGIGLVTINPATQVFAQVTPNAGVQLLGACANAKMAAGMHYTWYGDGTAFGTASPPTAGSWLGQVPLVTNSITPLPTNAFISAIAAGGTYTGSSGGGLLKLRVRYNIYGNIAQ